MARFFGPTGRIHSSASSVDGAPAGGPDAEYITASPDPDLSSERVLTNTPTIAWNFATANQARADARTQLSISSDAAGLKLLNDADIPGVDKYYGTNLSGDKGWHLLPLSTTETEYLYSNNNTMADPGSGKFRTNTALFSTATQTGFNDVANTGIDRSNLLKTVRQGDLILMQDKNNAANWVRYQVSAPITDNGTWFLIPIVFVEGGGTIPTNNSPVLVVFTANGTTGSVPNNFQTIAVAGQSNVVADAPSDTLTFVAGANITITTDPATDSITIVAASGGLSNGDKGDITVGGSGSSLTIDSNVIASGTYTPILTNELEISSSTAYPAAYMRIRNIVSVAGMIDISSTLGGQESRVRISLPISSVVNQLYHVAGTATSQGSNPQAARIVCQTTANEARLFFNPTVTTSKTWSFTFMYLIQ